MDKHAETEVIGMLSLKRTEWRNRITSIIQAPMFYALLINILIRIPYFPHAQGSDAFVVAWMAQAIQEGFIDAWIINPLSIFGLYPYSFYPIGGPFILSIFFIMGFSVDSALFLYSYLFMFVSIVTTYYLGKLIFSNDRLCTFFFVVFYTTSPVFLGYTYWTATVRGPFAAVLPLTLYFLLKLIKEFNVKNIIYFLVSIVILALMHRLIIIYPIFLLSLGCAILLIKVNFLKRRLLPIYLFSYLCAFIIGILVFPISLRITTEFLLKNDSIIGVAWNLAIDYALKFGIISLLAIWGFFNQFSFSESDNTEMTIQMFFLVLGFFLVFVTPISIYTSTLLLPWFGYFAVFGLKSIIKRQLKWIKYLLGIFPSFFGLLYSCIIIVLPIHLFTAALLAIASTLKITIKSNNNHLERINPFFVILCFSIVIFSRISVDGLIVSGYYPFNYVSEDEFIIAEYLEKYNSRQEIIVVYNGLVARRIQAISFQPVLRPINYAASVYYGWISVEEIQNNTVFDFSQLIRVGIPFMTNCSFPEDLFYYVSSLDLRIKENINAIHNARIRYVITNNPNTGDSIPKSPLFTSIHKYGVLRVETRYLCLYEIP